MPRHAFAFRSLALALAFSIASIGARSCIGADDADTSSPHTATVTSKASTVDAAELVKLPGLSINAHERIVDLAATVCLDEGMLELIACSKGTKEHESIVAVTARPMHIHAALLALGAKNGRPAMRRAVDAEQTRWVDVPPRGDRVAVSLVVEDSEGACVEHPIAEFVTRSDRDPDETDDTKDLDASTERERATNRFPSSFIFAGSHLHDDGKGPRKYLADESGHVISIATFGDELLCLPGMHEKTNDALMWRIDAAKLPEVGTEVIVRLRPHVEPAAPTDGRLSRPKETAEEPADDEADDTPSDR